jgi:magnesium-transporting ATPase (P-type)
MQATTACLSAIIVLQIVMVFLCRSAVRSVVAMPLTDNRWILCGVALEIALLVVYNYVPLANWLLDTSPVPPAVWLIIVPMAVATLALEEGRKAWVRRRLGRTGSKPRPH